MKLSNEQLNNIMAKADNDLDALKDRCHDLYDENQELKKKCNMYEMRMYEEENAKNKYKAIIDKVIELLGLYAGESNNFCLDYHEINEIYEILEGANK